MNFILRIDRVANLFKAAPYVFVYGDLNVGLSLIYNRSPVIKNLGWDKLEDSDKTTLEKSILLQNNIQKYQSEYIAFMTDFKVLTNISNLVTDEAVSSFYNCVINGLSLLEKIYTAITLQTAWKYSNPKIVQGPATSYEMAVQYNYDNDAKKSLLLVIPKP